MRSSPPMTNDTNNEHLDQLNHETGKLEWKELERHFARGAVIKVDTQLDLVVVATQFTQDNKEQVQAWLDADLISRASSADASSWNEQQSLFWAIVTMPWVLVQEIKEQ